LVEQRYKIFEKFPQQVEKKEEHPKLCLENETSCTNCTVLTIFIAIFGKYTFTGL